jgi:hypothetical protein
MGRFYQTAKPEFIDNFIYQPPWELIQQNNLLKAQNYETEQQTFNLLNNLDIPHWDKPDGELAKNKQQEYQQATEALVDMYKKDPESEQAKTQLRDLQRKLYQDYTYGDISKIKKNKEQYDKYMAYAEKLPPGDKEIFLRQVDNYLKPNIDGTVNNALNKSFDYMEHQGMVTGEDYFKSDRFKTLEADTEAYANTSIGREWLYKNSKSVEDLKKEKIAKDFRDWIQEQNLDKNNWDKYWSQVGGIENLYDKEGKLGFEKGTYFGDMIESGATTHAYKKVKSDKDVDINPITDREDRQAFEREMEERRTRNQIKAARAASGGRTESDTGVGPDVGVETAKILAGHSKMEELMNSLFGESGKKIGKTPQQYMSYAMSQPKEWQDKHKNVMKNIKDVYKESMKLPIASRAMLQQSFKSYTPEVEALLIKNAKISKGNFLVPSLNSTHGSSKATLTDLKSGRFLINGKKPKANSILINGESVYTVPSNTLEGSVAVYPVTFTDEKTGVITNDFLYKNIGEIIKGK